MTLLPLAVCVLLALIFTLTCQEIDARIWEES